MIAAFRVRESFSHEESFQILQPNCGWFAAEFTDGITEFFYYLKPDDADRWFFIRSNTTDSQKFVSAASSFAENLGFEILTRAAIERLLRKIKLDSFV